MKLTIFAATGGIGRQALSQAVAAGHEVTAVVRNPGQVAAHVSVVRADLARSDPAAIESAVAGADAVLSGLGPRNAADAGIVSRGTREIVRAMRATGARRIIVVSAAPVGTVASPGRPEVPRHDPGDGFLTRYLLSPMIKSILRAQYADLALMEEILAGSGLDWTAVRPPRLTGRPLSGKYRTEPGRNVTRGLTISRADVAHLMLRLAGDPGAGQQTVGVAY